MFVLFFHRSVFLTRTLIGWPLTSVELSQSKSLFQKAESRDVGDKPTQPSLSQELPVESFGTSVDAPHMSYFLCTGNKSDELQGEYRLNMDVIYSGWLVKSPPEKKTQNHWLGKIFQAVSWDFELWYFAPLKSISTWFVYRFRRMTTYTSARLVPHLDCHDFVVTVYCRGAHLTKPYVYNVSEL